MLCLASSAGLSCHRIPFDQIASVTSTYSLLMKKYCTSSKRLGPYFICLVCAADGGMLGQTFSSDFCFSFS